MSTIGTALTTWDDFLQMPDPEEGYHYELHDGEVALMPPPKPIHIKIQSLLIQWLFATAAGQGRAVSEFPYRPVANLQFWYADVAYVPNEDWRAMSGDTYPIYAPPLVVEVLSPSNRPDKIQRQRIAAFSAGTREFWVVDPDARTIEVSIPGSTSRIYGVDDSVPLTVISGAALPVITLFQD